VDLGLKFSSIGLVLLVGREKGRYGGRAEWSDESRMDAPEIAMLLAAFASRPKERRPKAL
jgi:hypothetical protein